MSRGRRDRGHRLAEARELAAVGDGSAIRAGYTQRAPALRVRPRPLGWVINALLFVFSVPLIGLGALWLATGNIGIGVIFVGPGLLLAVFPTAYFAVAKIELSNGVLTRVALFWRVARCPAQSLRSIVWFQTTQYLYGGVRRGYKFRQADGRTVFTVSPFWWSHTDIARLGISLGVAVDGGPAAVEQMRLLDSGRIK